MKSKIPLVEAPKDIHEKSPARCAMHGVSSDRKPS